MNRIQGPMEAQNFLIEVLRLSVVVKRVSNQIVLRMICTIGLLLQAGTLWAQSPPTDPTEKAAIDHAKTILVSSLDRSLPKITLEYFLQYESKGAPIHWEVNDCGEQTGDPATDPGRDFPMCVQADFDVQHRAVSVMIAVGTSRKGVSGPPQVFSVTVTAMGGAVHSVKRLGSLPAELHLPLPSSPRDLLPPAGFL